MNALRAGSALALFPRLLVAACAAAVLFGCNSTRSKPDPPAAQTSPRGSDAQLKAERERAAREHGARGMASGDADAGNNGASPRELPAGSDDDIVARRLRKAAEQETDPELKEKLWKEYIEYRKNRQSR